MESIQEERRETFYSNLLLLGFDANSLEKKHSISFHQDMFLVPNKTAFEVVSYFLFTKLNEITNNEFRIVWPVFDSKLAQEFRKTCYSHLTKIAKDNVDGVRFPRMYPSLLMTPCGDRFYELYLAFSTYVMQRCVDEDNIYHRPKFVLLDKANLYEVQEKSLKLFTICATKEFLETEKESLKEQELWETTSENFLTYYKDTKLNICQLSIEKKEQLDILCEKCFIDTSISDEKKLEIAILKKNEKVEKVLSMWKAIEEHLGDDELLWNNISSELDSEQNQKLVLDGQQYMIPMPEMIKVNYKDDLVEKKVQCLVENGKLSVKNFMNLWTITIKCYNDLLRKESLPNTNDMISKLKNNIEQLRYYLSKAKNLSQKFTKMIDEEAEQVEKLEETIYSLQNADPPTEFLPFTPTLTFTPKSGRKSSVIPENFLSKSPNTTHKYSLSKRKEFHSSSPLPFNALNILNTPGENCGHLTPGSENGSSKKSMTQKKHFTTLQQETPTQDIKTNNGDFYLSCFSDEHTLHEDATSVKSFDTTHSFSKVEKASDELTDSPMMHSPQVDLNENETASNAALSEKKLSQISISNLDSREFNLQSIKKLAKFSKHLCPANDLSSKENFNFSGMSFSEEMLDDIEMPEIPFF